MVTPCTQSGCAYIWPSTVDEKSLPNWVEFTFFGVRNFSTLLDPVRPLLYCCVYTPNFVCPIANGRHEIARKIIAAGQLKRAVLMNVTSSANRRLDLKGRVDC